MTSLTDKIALLKKLHGESTVERWTVDCARESPQTKEYALYCVRIGCAHWVPNTPPYTVEQMRNDRTNAEFIAAAHNHLPDVLAEVERLERALGVIRTLALYCLGPTRDVKTPKIQEIAAIANQILGGGDESIKIESPGDYSIVKKAMEENPGKTIYVKNIWPSEW